MLCFFSPQSASSLIKSLLISSLSISLSSISASISSSAPVKLCAIPVFLLGYYPPLIVCTFKLRRFLPVYFVLPFILFDAYSTILTEFRSYIRLNIVVVAILVISVDERRYLRPVSISSLPIRLANPIFLVSNRRYPLHTYLFFIVASQRSILQVMKVLFNVVTFPPASTSIGFLPQFVCLSQPYTLLDSRFHLFYHVHVFLLRSSVARTIRRFIALRGCYASIVDIFVAIVLP